MTKQVKRREKMTKTVCYLCAASACGMEVTVQDGRITSVRGDKHHPESRGALCAKGRAVKEFVYSPDRLKYPLKRAGQRGEGKWERISWDRALVLIAEKLQQIKKEYGSEAVAFHKGYMHAFAGDIWPYFQRLANVFGSPNFSVPWNECHVPRMAPMFHMTGAVPTPEVEKTGCILLWGHNPAATSMTQHKNIMEAVKSGARLIVIDPRTIFYTKRADLHLQPRPGTDGALALGLLRVIVDEGLFDGGFVSRWTEGFEELKGLLKEYPLEKVERITWVPQDHIIKAARLYATTKPACIIPGNSFDHHTNNSQSVRAITILMSVTGNLDSPGGNIILPPIMMGKTRVELNDKLPPEKLERRLGKEFLGSQFMQMAHPPSVIRAILEEEPYPVKAMLILGANPALTLANSKMVEAALKNLDFLAVVDIFMTKTAGLADIVLPSCTFLEQTYYATYDICPDTKSMFPGLLMLRPQVIPPLNESRSDLQIIFDLADKMGFSEYFPWKDIGEVIDYELKPLGITFKDLQDNPEGIKVPGPSFLYEKFGNKGPMGRILIWLLNNTLFRNYPQMYHKYRMMKFMTPSKKVEILSRQLEKMGYDALPVYDEPKESPLSKPDLYRDYPLVLTTGGKSDFFVHSQMRNIPSLAGHMPTNLAELHPDTAIGLGIKERDDILIESLRGTIICRAKITKGIRSEMIHIFHGFEDSNCNYLIDNLSFDPMTGSEPFRSTLCRVKKA